MNNINTIASSWCKYHSGPQVSSTLATPPKPLDPPWETGLWKSLANTITITSDGAWKKSHNSITAAIGWVISLDSITISMGDTKVLGTSALQTEALAMLQRIKSTTDYANQIIMHTDLIQFIQSLHSPCSAPHNIKNIVTDLLMFFNRFPAVRCVKSSMPPGINLRSINSPGGISNMGSYEQQFLQQYQQQQNQQQFRLQQLPSLNQTFREQGVKPIQSPQTAPDPYGLLGLLSVIRMSDPDLTSLALGIDLTTLGLNLNSSENLHKTFASPWSDEPAKGEPEFTIPECYHGKPPPPLSQAYFAKFQLPTLFYIFYSMPRDEAQLYAANELYNRSWFYHKDLRFWFMRVPNVDPLVKTNLYERGSYVVFDPNTWDTSIKENFVIHYELIEKRPSLHHQVTNS